jgi:hypothetical protein
MFEKQRVVQLHQQGYCVGYISVRLDVPSEVCTGCAVIQRKPRSGECCGTPSESRKQTHESALHLTPGKARAVSNPHNE